LFYFIVVVVVVVVVVNVIVVVVVVVAVVVDVDLTYLVQCVTIWCMQSHSPTHSTPSPFTIK
jgi:hypothetical protein